MTNIELNTLGLKATFSPVVIILNHISTLTLAQRIELQVNGEEQDFFEMLSGYYIPTLYKKRATKYVRWKRNQLVAMTTKPVSFGDIKLMQDIWTSLNFYLSEYYGWPVIPFQETFLPQQKPPCEILSL